MKNIIVTIFFIVLNYNSFAQTKVEYIFNSERPFVIYKDNLPQLTHLKLSNAKEKYQSMLFFLGFDKDSINIKNGSNELIKRNLIYSEQTGISGINVINNTKELKINFLKEYPIEIILNIKDLKKFKYIYLTRKKDLYTVEFSNILKIFG